MHRSTSSLLRLRAPVVLTLTVAVGCVATARAAELRPETLAAWKRYERLTEERIASELEAEAGFLVQDFLSRKERLACTGEVEAGRACVQSMRTLAPGGEKIEVPKGLIHHWMGSIRIPQADLEELLAWVQNYDGHEPYFEEVEESRLLSRDGDEFRILLRLRQEDRHRPLPYGTRGRLQPARAAARLEPESRHPHRRAGRRRDEEGTGEEARQRQWLPVAAQLILEAHGRRRGRGGEPRVHQPESGPPPPGGLVYQGLRQLRAT
jgi:hypothetical protein